MRKDKNNVGSQYCSQYAMPFRKIGQCPAPSVNLLTERLNSESY